MNNWGCRFGLLLIPLLTALADFPQKTSTVADPGYDFSEHKRYSWRENRLLTRQHPDTNEEMDRKIVKNVNQVLSASGFVEVKEKPDFYIYYDGGGDAMTAVASISTRAASSISPLTTTIVMAGKCLPMTRR